MTPNAAAPELDNIEAMFVQIARTSWSGKGILVLDGISPSTLFFSDRPQRVVGHLSSDDFVALWSEGANSFAADPPNAVLAFLESDEKSMDDVVVILRDPHLNSDRLSYRVEVIENELPEASGPCSLFIDPLGRPLSPMSVMGMHRRTRRRTRRRMR
jgi:hypothetical protein